jgi:hypothetical protein
MAEVFHGLIYRQQFAIIGAIILLCGIEFFGKEGERLHASHNSQLFT